MLGMQAAGAEMTTRVGPAPDAAVVALAIACAASLAVLVHVALRIRRGLPAVAPRPHPSATWRGGDVAVVALVYVGILAAVGTTLTRESPLRLQLLVDVVTKAAATLVGIGVLRGAGASWAALGFAGGRWGEDLRLAVGALALAVAPLLALAAALDRIVPYRHPVVTLLDQHRDPVAVALVVLAAVIVAPVAEEFFFRRVLQGWLEERLPEADGAAAVGLSAAAFAASHVGHGLAPVPLFLFGLLLGAIARATGSLVPCVLLHALFNAVSVAIMLSVPASPGAGGG